MTTHLMLDLETLGTRVGSVVLSAALVRFSDEAHCSVNLSIPEQEALGLTQDAATLEWWLKQAPESRVRATENPVPVRSALDFLTRWIAWAGAGGDTLVWCHGATFDCPLLGEVYRLAGYATPWQYWAVRDTRTLYDLAGIDPKQFAVPPPHVALNDAIGQTRAANVALSILARAHAVAA